MSLERVEIPFGSQNLIIETGKFAKQANGAVTVQYGGSVVLVTACVSKEQKPEADFLPLTVEYQEKTYAAGRIPGGFFKREGRPSESEILVSRLIDRPLRPLFPKGFLNEIQIMGIVLSSDVEFDPDILAIIGASAALSISEIPFNGPIASCRVGLVDGQFILNPTYEQRDKGVLDLVMVGKENGLIMLEGKAKEAQEEQILEAIKFGSSKLADCLSIQEKLVKLCGKAKMQTELKTVNKELIKKVRELSLSKVKEICQISQKEEREESLNLLWKELSKDLSVFNAIEPQVQFTEADIKQALVEIECEVVRNFIIEHNQRVDGRSLNEIRPISCEVGILPRTHGSGLFTRGQTQSLAVTTLGTRSDEQMIEALEGESHKSFMLHYSFPPFSVGEIRPVRGPGRREIGHGALSERSLQPVMPPKEEFPYTIRVVSEILESNGSSSMATVCAASLSLMDAGVPIKEPVAGISLGLIKDGATSILLTDITGLEDHFGDMDFKVAGTKNGTTVIQLDLKIDGIDIATLERAIEQSREARQLILSKMKEVISSPRKSLSSFAPRIITLKINPAKIGELIGPGGKTIRKIIETTGVTIDIEDDGSVLVASTDSTASDKAIEIIKGLTEEVEVGKIYLGKIKRITNFGAFCEILPGKEGLIHISELSDKFVKNVEEVVKVGEEVKVKVIEIDELGRINLSKKQAE